MCANMIKFPLQMLNVHQKEKLYRFFMVSVLLTVEYLPITRVPFIKLPDGCCGKGFHNDMLVSRLDLCTC
jgi:hypothetical protein